MKNLPSTPTESSLAAVRPPQESERMAEERQEMEARAWQKRFAKHHMADRTLDKAVQDATLRVQGETGLLPGVSGAMAATATAASGASRQGMRTEGESGTGQLDDDPPEASAGVALDGVPNPEKVRDQVEASREGGVDDLDIAVDDMAAMAANDGIFELLFPSGESIGVAVSTQDFRTSFLLTPSTGDLASRLQERKAGMAAQLERRMQRTVSITVL